MGVTGLWNIVTPLSKVRTMSELRGQTVAIDLSGWIVDSQSVGPSDGCPNKHLRNLFFRATALLLSQINPVFVLEGKAPVLKHDAIRERRKNAGKIKAKGGRGNLFNATTRQCEKLLKLMGLTCVQAQGEAEAMCAHLNADGLVDACISQDSDCFLYGAKTVYRNFTLVDKTGFGSSVEEYKYESIESIYGLGRNKMIALALLCGCDYDSGVPGIGKDGALKFLKSIDDQDVLSRFKKWRDDDGFDDYLTKSTKNTLSEEEKKMISSENNIRRKCLVVENFPNEELIDEFVTRKGKVPKTIEKWRIPDIKELIVFLERELQWTTEYAIKKVFPLLTRWQIENSSEIPSRTDSLIVAIPQSIKKIRNIQSISLFEIVWDITSRDLAEFDEENEPEGLNEHLSSIEPQELVRKAYPDLVQVFEDLKNAKKTKGTKRKPKSTTESTKMTKEPKKPTKKHQNSDKTAQNPSTSSLNHPSSISKSDSEVSSLLNDLNADDFATDVEDDCLDMSLIVSRVCETENNLKESKITSITSLITGEVITNAADSVTNVKTVNLDDSEDDYDIPYIPLAVRLNK